MGHPGAIQTFRCCTGRERSEAESVQEAKNVVVTFPLEDIYLTACVGDNLLEVAASAGIEIQTGCLSGSCGACEVEVLWRKSLQANKDNCSEGEAPCKTRVVRSCITLVEAPDNRGDHLEVSTLADDDIWGS
ncbi:hypothetical protein CYMTET_11005 [Cymbomonas tetramitiformis]|uniref:2Fe-2S ferredoxin-type domain-containing protein n=1 Tax=Cymbomonas tetramitiformis TaxID=36881 RepID=A0AAE0GND2_9CHLO|nr:hypothetical protein CYMTET_11005 [Cymbomonas tetramitiformis]